MVNRRSSSPTLEGTNSNSDIDTLAKMHAAMDELRHHNQILENDVYNIRPLKQESNPPEKMKVLDP